MGFTMRISRPGFDALTDSTIDHYSIFSDTDNILIKEKARGTIDVSYNGEGTISHGLGYTPFYLIYSPISSTRYRINNSFDALGGGWRAYSDNDNVYIKNFYGTANTVSKYYIFYDNVGGTI